MSEFFGWICLGGVVVGLGIGGLFVLIFSPRVVVPGWLFILLSASLVATLGGFLGVAVDIALQNPTPVLGIIGGIGGLAMGAYYGRSVFQARVSL